MFRRVVALTLVASLVVWGPAVPVAAGASETSMAAVPSFSPVAGHASATPADEGASSTRADHVLVVADAETGERYLVQPIANGTDVALEYDHSVEQSRVYEQYTVRGDRLEETRVEFESYGWGLPSDANVTEVNGTFVYDPEGSLTRLTVVPGEIAGHELHVGADAYDLVALTDGRAVDVYLVPQCNATAASGGDGGG